jgi:hypothetical protein
MQSISKYHTPEVMEKLNEIGGVNLTLQQSGVQLGEILSAEAIYDGERKILRKIDRL